MEELRSEVLHIVDSIQGEVGKVDFKFKLYLTEEINNFFTQEYAIEEEMKQEEDLILKLVKMIEDDEKPLSRKKRRRTVISEVNFWDTYWGQLISHPNVKNPKAKEGKQFRRRFRLPFPVFEFLVKLCEQHNIFETIYKTKIPIQAKILSCLRWLGRDECADSINEASNQLIAESTAYPIFRKFINGMVDKIYPCFVKFPTGAELDKVMHSYAELGLPGAVGSMDCTHIEWMMCPKAEKFAAKGKEGYPTLAFQVLVDHNKRVLSCSQHFLGKIILQMNCLFKFYIKCH